MATATVLYRRVGRVFVGVHGETNPSEADWADMMKAMRSAVGLGCVLIYSAGATLNATQRSEAAAAIKKHNARVVLITDSILARGAVTAIGWIAGSIKAFSPAQLQQGINYLQLSTLERSQVQSTVAELRAQLRV